MNLNYMKWTEERCRTYLAEGLVHLHFVISLYDAQLRGGRHFLHEHPASADSWEESSMQELLAQPGPVLS